MLKRPLMLHKIGHLDVLLVSVPDDIALNVFLDLPLIQPVHVPGTGVSAWCGAGAWDLLAAPFIPLPRVPSPPSLELRTVLSVSTEKIKQL